MPETVEADRFVQPTDKLRALRARAHKTHLPAQDVDHLRRLVKMRLAQDFSSGSDTRIIQSGPLRPSVAFRSGAHAAELKQLELKNALHRKRDQPHASERQSFEPLQDGQTSRSKGFSDFPKDWA